MLAGAAAAFGVDALRRVGSVEQLVRVDRATLVDGPAAGSPVLNVRNPGGISFEVLLDRAMDVGWADACGVPLSWASSVGRVASVRHEPQGSGWTRTFGGGLLATCGLASTGQPSERDSVHYGLHGRVGHLAASGVTWRLEGSGDDACVRIEGHVIEAALGEPTLRLSRTIRAWCHHSSLEVSDVVTNDGYRSAGHMFRHHLNLGYPLIDDSSTLVTNGPAFGGRGGRGAASLGDVDLSTASSRVDEQVLYVGSEPDPWVRINSPSTGLSARIQWTSQTFPLLVVWRDRNPGVNVLGIEPSTSRDDGRVAAERDGEVVLLAPGEERTYRTRFDVAPGASGAGHPVAPIPRDELFT